MQRFSWLLALVLFATLSASAQTTPQVELFGGYSRFIVNVNGPQFHLNGGTVSAAENINRWVGGVVDFSAYGGTMSGVNVNSQLLLLGPRFTLRKAKGFTPFGHFLIGFSRGSRGYLGISESASRFALAGGGGLDINVGDKLAIRVIQADYVMTRFLSLRQDNLRLASGVVFRFGKK